MMNKSIQSKKGRKSAILNGELANRLLNCYIAIFAVIKSVKIDSLIFLSIFIHFYLLCIKWSEER